MPAEQVTLPLTGFGDGTVDVAVDSTPEGVIEYVKLAISQDGSSLLIPATLDGLYVQPRLESPQDELLIATNVSAGANTDLTATAIPGGKTGRLMGADIGASVPMRCDVQVIDGSRITRTTIYTQPGETFPWRVPIGSKWIELVGGALKSFGASVTNLDVSQAADLRVTLFWDEITP